MCSNWIFCRVTLFVLDSLQYAGCMPRGYIFAEKNAIVCLPHFWLDNENRKLFGSSGLRVFGWRKFAYETKPREYKASFVETRYLNLSYIFQMEKKCPRRFHKCSAEYKRNWVYPNRAQSECLKPVISNFTASPRVDVEQNVLFLPFLPCFSESELSQILEPICFVRLTT